MTDERTDAIRCDSVDSTKRRVCMKPFGQRQTIHYRHIVNQHEDDTSVTAYTPSEKTRWPKLAALALWALKKCGWEQWYPQFEVAEHYVKNETVIKWIEEQAFAVWDMVGHSGGIILMGAKQWSEIAGDPLLASAMRFNVPHGGPRFMDMEIVILPWMDGVLVLPQGSHVAIS